MKYAFLIAFYIISNQTVSAQIDSLQAGSIDSSLLLPIAETPPPFEEAIVYSTLSVNYYIPNTLQRDYSYVKFWVKKKPNKNQLANFRKDRIGDLKQGNIPTIGYDKYSYTLLRYVCDCSDNKIAIEDMIDYDSNGKPLSNYSSKIHFSKIVPESTGEDIIKFGCKYKNILISY